MINIKEKFIDSFKSKRFFLYGGLIVLLLAFDLVTKAVVDAADLKVKLIPGVIEIMMSYNTGSAFSFLAGKPWAQTFFIVLTSIVILVLIAALFLVPSNKRLLKYSLALLIGGALGNLVDRIWLHHVRDFMYLPWFGNSICNFADYFIVIGCVLLFIHLLFTDEDAIFKFKKKDE